MYYYKWKYRIFQGYWTYPSNCWFSYSIILYCRFMVDLANYSYLAISDIFVLYFLDYSRVAIVRLADIMRLLPPFRSGIKYSDYLLIFKSMISPLLMLVGSLEGFLLVKPVWAVLALVVLFNYRASLFYLLSLEMRMFLFFISLIC